ncbi:MAG: sulfotransferase domain-containing protein, partial [Hyphomicrobiales bacterium]
MRRVSPVSDRVSVKKGAARAAAKPDFLVIGAQKCGTTWLQEMLHQHPDVFVPEIKEVNYFVRAEHNRH